MARPLLLLLLALLPHAAHAARLSFCSEPNEGPPWYYVDKSGALPRAAGFTPDMLSAVFQRMGHEVHFRYDLPWKRCLQMVEQGEVDFAMNAYFDEDRARRLAYSKPYKLLTPQVFMSAARPVQISHIRDLKRYRGCGMLGSSYRHYGLKEGELDQGTHSYRTLMAKLKSGRCDYVVEEREVIAAIGLGGPSALIDDPGLRHQDIAGAKSPGLHLVSGRKQASARLLPQFDAEIEAFLKSGAHLPLWKKYAGTTPY